MVCRATKHDKKERGVLKIDSGIMYHKNLTHKYLSLLKNWILRHVFELRMYLYVFLKEYIVCFWFSLAVFLWWHPFSASYMFYSNLIFLFTQFKNT